MRVVRLALAIGLWMTLLVGCGESEAPVAPQVDVEGTVTYNGAAMSVPDAEISFLVPGQAPVNLPISNGKFAGKAPVGQVRVEIRAYKLGEPIMMDGKPFGEPQKVNYISPEFNDLSTLMADIPAAGVRDLKFEVVDKT